MSDDGDKTEEPTDHKLQEARKKGQVLKSQEIISTICLASVAGMMLMTGKFMYTNITTFTVSMWDLISAPHLVDRRLLPDMIRIAFTVLVSLLPLLTMVWIFAVIANVGQVGLLFTVEPMKPSLSKINPIEGVKRIFSMKSVMELVKQILKVSVIGYLCFKAVKDEIPLFQMAPGWDLVTTALVIKKIIIRCVSWTLVGMVVLSILDYLFQKKQFMKQMRMSHQEMKDEYKETEGNPHVKAKMRQMMRQGSQGRMMEEVPNASAVVTNPTHMAIAIRYKAGEDQVPVVVAKGERTKAQQIKVLAEDNDVPIIENVELARALFGACEVGQAIPTEMYKAVAEVLAYIIKLKRKKQLKMKQRKAGGR